MTTISGANYYNFNQVDFQRKQQTQQTQPQNSVYTTGISQSSAGIVNASATNSAGSTQAAQSSACKDGKDDGHISFWDKLKNLGKGCLKFVTNLWTDENGNFSFGKLLKSVAIGVAIGAVCFFTAGTAVPALIAAGGVAMSAVGVGKAAYKAATAKTDAEAEEAWQSIGTNGVALAASVVGAKAVAKSAHAGTNYNGLQGSARAVKDVFVDSGKAIGSNFKGVSSAKSLSANLSTIKSNVNGNIESVTTAVKGRYTELELGHLNKKIDQAKTELKDAMSKNDAEAQAAANKKLGDYQAELNKIKNQPSQKSTTSSNTNYREQLRTRLNKLKEKSISELVDNAKSKIEKSYKSIKDKPIKDLGKNTRVKFGKTLRKGKNIAQQGVDTLIDDKKLLGTATVYASKAA